MNHFLRALFDSQIIFPLRSKGDWIKRWDEAASEGDGITGGGAVSERAGDEGEGGSKYAAAGVECDYFPVSGGAGY